jgi:hypothetical protein
MGGDFLSNLEGMALLVREEHGVTFAPEIGQQHTGSLIKNKREVIGILWIKISREVKAVSFGMNSKQSPLNQRSIVNDVAKITYSPLLLHI